MQRLGGARTLHDTYNRSHARRSHERRTAAIAAKSYWSGNRDLNSDHMIPDHVRYQVTLFPEMVILVGIEPDMMRVKISYPRPLDDRTISIV